MRRGWEMTEREKEVRAEVWHEMWDGQTDAEGRAIEIEAQTIISPTWAVHQTIGKCGYVL